MKSNTRDRAKDRLQKIKEGNKEKTESPDVIQKLLTDGNSDRIDGKFQIEIINNEITKENRKKIV
jgi:hypothetical protein